MDGKDPPELSEQSLLELAIDLVSLCQKITFPSGFVCALRLLQYHIILQCSEGHNKIRIYYNTYNTVPAVGS